MFRPAVRTLSVKRPSEITTALRRRVLVATGHRPKRLGDYGEEARLLLVEFAERWLEALAPRGLITGMADGWDLALAEVAQRRGVPYLAAVPCDDQDRLWRPETRGRYRRLLAAAKKTAVVTPGPYSPGCMERRNRWMFDEGVRHDALPLALWDGGGGGTFDFLVYATSRGVAALNVWADFADFRRGAVRAGGR
jgi:uncharacterized phage-like protein YoqJ